MVAGFASSALVLYDGVLYEHHFYISRYMLIISMALVICSKLYTRNGKPSLYRLGYKGTVMLVAIMIVTVFATVIYLW